jgi:hypothetical protein
MLKIHRYWPSRCSKFILQGSKSVRCAVASDVGVTAAAATDTPLPARANSIAPPSPAYNNIDARPPTAQLRSRLRWTAPPRIICRNAPDPAGTAGRRAISSREHPPGAKYPERQVEPFVRRHPVGIEPAARGNEPHAWVQSLPYSAHATRQAKSKPNERKHITARNWYAAYGVVPPLRIWGAPYSTLDVMPDAWSTPADVPTASKIDEIIFIPHHPARDSRRESKAEQNGPRRGAQKPELRFFIDEPRGTALPAGIAQRAWTGAART